MTDQPQEFLDLFRIYTLAAARKDVALMASLYDEEVIVFDVFDAWSATGRDDWRAAIENWFRSDDDGRIVVEFGDVRVRGDGDVRSSHAIVSFATVSGDGRVLRSMQNRLTWVAKRTAGRWAILHQHTSVPIGSATLQGVLSRAAAA